ncbi:hypothetical protein [Pseudosulfitobacter pseudonitzschiae]|uniref:hypothetical protein n=1 Tax=Pseudosulfitobacter pseudonitzschiae TaxID=1402135 RepID=UPI003B80121B
MSGEKAEAPQHDFLTIEKLAEEVKPFFGQMVLVHRHELAVLEGVGEDLHDLYYIARPVVRRPPHYSKEVWYSAVGHCEGLKQYLPAEMHDALLSQRKMNGGLPEKFVMKFDQGAGKIVDYDPNTHPALRRKLQEEEHARALSRNQETDDEDIDIRSLFEAD